MLDVKKFYRRWKGTGRLILTWVVHSVSYRAEDDGKRKCRSSGFTDSDVDFVKADSSRCLDDSIVSLIGNFVGMRLSCQL